MTAIWSLSLSRSAPATLTPRIFRARIIASKKALRRLTRIMTSPARIGRGASVFGSTTRSREPAAVQRAICSAIRPARITGGAWAAGSSSGIRQSSGSAGFSASTVGQISTTPLRVFRIASCKGGGSPSSRRPVRAASVANVMSTAARMAGAERNEKLSGTRSNGFCASRQRRSKCAPHLAEKLGRRALEGEDRLFLVPDREHGAIARSRALSGKELLGQRFDNAPLLGRIVLRLVDQQVVEAIVELLHHPGGARLRHQRERAGNLVGKVERAAPGLGSGESLEDRDRDGEQGDAAFQRLGGAALLAQAFETRLLALEVAFQTPGACRAALCR